MIQYNVWFALKQGVDEKPGLAVVSDYLGGLASAGEAVGHRLLRNASDGARSKLPRYQAIVEFRDDAALSAAMKNQGARGIHNGGHGAIVDVVTDFRVEIFRYIDPEEIGILQYACEI
jgi:hypothetical protein